MVEELPDYGGQNHERRLHAVVLVVKVEVRQSCVRSGDKDSKLVNRRASDLCQRKRKLNYVEKAYASMVFPEPESPLHQRSRAWETPSLHSVNV